MQLHGIHSKLLLTNNSNDHVRPMCKLWKMRVVFCTLLLNRFFSSGWCRCTLLLAHIYSGFILSVHLNNITLLTETNRAWLLLLLFCFFCSLVTHIFSFFSNSFCLEAKNILCLYSDIVITMVSYKRDTQQRKLIAMNFSCSWIIFATFFFFGFTCKHAFSILSFCSHFAIIQMNHIELLLLQNMKSVF